MSRLSRLATMAAAGGMVAAGLVAAPTAASAADAPPANIGYYARGYATNVHLAGNAIHSGATANSQIACTNVSGLDHHNSIASVDLGTAGSIGAATTKATSATTSTRKTSTAKTTIANLNLLNGLITATSLTSTASAWRLPHAYRSKATNTFVGLSIAGNAIPVNVAPNTVIQIPGIAKVTVNGQATSHTGIRSGATSTALRVQLLPGNPLGLDLGSDVIVGRAAAAATRPQTAFASGRAAGTYVSALNTALTSGFTANANMPCNNGSHHADVAAVNLQPVASVNGVASNTTTHVGADTITAHATNTIASVNVLAGLISVGTIKADATATRSQAGGSTTYTDNSSFGSLSVAGFPLLNANVAPNTTITLPLLGKVTFHSVVKSKNGIYVAMIKIEIGAGNTVGLPVGTRILIGYSAAGTKAPAH